MTGSHAARRDAILREGWTEELLRLRQAQRASSIKRAGYGQGVPERAGQERRPLSSSVAILATLSSGLKPVTPILRLLLLPSLAYAQSEPAQATQGLGEVIVDTLLWIGTVVIVSSIGMVLVSLFVGAIVTFLTLICGGPKAVREAWRKRERD